MSHSKSICAMSLDEIINEAIEREVSLMGFYSEALRNVGPDAWNVFNAICEEHHCQIAALNKLQIEIHDIRELTDSIAD